MNHLPLIIKREYLTKVKNKSFIVMTFVSPLIMIILASVVAYLTQLNNEKVRNVSILDESGLVYDVFKSNDKTTFNVLSNMSIDEAKAFSKESEAYGLLHIGDFKDVKRASKSIQFYSEESPSLSLISDLESKLETKLTNLNLLDNGVDVDMINASKISVNIAQESFQGEKTSKTDSVVKLIFGGAAGYLLFMFIIIYGNMIMRSVIEEKTSRIIEVIISSVKPVQLMLGKIIGTSLAGITQFIIWLIIGSILLTVISVIFGINVVQSSQQDMMNQAMANPEINAQVQSIISSFYNLPLTNLIFAFILFFIGGYLLYSSLYAAIGAAVDNETDTQQFMLPIITPLMLAVYIGLFTVIEDPHGTVSTIFSFIPFTSPVVMLMRIPFGVPLWQQGLSFVILVATFMLTVWFAAKIYRVGILMYGKKPSYKELIKWIKY
ncbi:ABC transporter permease [Aestuariibaculum sediminum]|uniref:ABC transporter permease n=1 Tax=Aestuariibaculum sediminum TaxID=2770637 RepID=A0A8J6UC80_9FLAO|nr:ABC transporter permease [Aestuariibaculum sediminum]MBD0832079.1 ABC transporter permease [Aestuariibaculum sediminum]